MLIKLVAWLGFACVVFCLIVLAWPLYLLGGVQLLSLKQRPLYFVAESFDSARVFEPADDADLLEPDPLEDRV